MNVGDVDHDFLRTRLGWPLTGTEPITVDSISHAGGDMGTVDRIGCAGRSFVFKGPPHDDSTWGTLLADMGRREVHTYSLLRSRGPAAPKVSPHCYWSAVDGRGRGALALEDLGTAPALPATMARGLGRDQALAAMRCLAVAHAGFARVGADPLVAPHPWLYTAASDGLLDAVRLGLEDLPGLAEAWWPDVCDAGAVRAVLALDVRTTIEGAHAGAPFATLCHGDAWAGNILFDPPGAAAGPVSAYLIDWQFAMWGNPLSDVAIFLMSSLTPEARAAWQDELLGTYCDVVAAHAEIDFTPADCLAAFRRVERGAALVALATVEGYTHGMSPTELAGFGPRVRRAIRTLIDEGSPSMVDLRGSRSITSPDAAPAGPHGKHGTLSQELVRELMTGDSWRALTEDRSKLETFAGDADFERGLGWAAGTLDASAASVLRSHAFLLIQPDCLAARMAETCVEFAERHGFRPVHTLRVRLDPRVVDALWFYQSDSSTPDSCTIGELVCGQSDALLVLFRDEEPQDGESASLRLTRLKGPARPERRTAGQLRSVIGAQDRLVVLIHTSDEPLDMIRESAIIAGPSAVEFYTRMAAPVPDDAGDQLAKHIEALYREVPEHDLDPVAAMKRLSETVTELASDAVLEPAARQLLATLERVRSGEGLLGWTEFADGLRAVGLDPTQWDPVLVGSRYIEIDVPDVPRRFAVSHPAPDGH